MNIFLEKLNIIRLCLLYLVYKLYYYQRHTHLDLYVHVLTLKAIVKYDF